MITVNNVEISKKTVKRGIILLSMVLLSLMFIPSYNQGIELHNEWYSDYGEIAEIDLTMNQLHEDYEIHKIRDGSALMILVLWVFTVLLFIWWKTE